MSVCKKMRSMINAFAYKVKSQCKPCKGSILIFVWLSSSLRVESLGKLKFSIEFRHRCKIEKKLFQQDLKEDRRFARITKRIFFYPMISLESWNSCERIIFVHNVARLREDRNTTQKLQTFKLRKNWKKKKKKMQIRSEISKAANWTWKVSLHGCNKHSSTNETQEGGGWLR